MWFQSKQKIINQLQQRSNPSQTFDKPSIVIKIAVSQWKRAHTWGDYHMAVLLKEQFEKIGHRVLIQVSSEWRNNEGLMYDVTLTFRGKKYYQPNPKQVNIMWNISHPDDISLEEYDAYDHIFIASSYWAEKVSKKLSTPVECMWQCTDPQRFQPLSENEKEPFHHQLLFVGNSRGIFRKIIKDLLPTSYELAVYGDKWEDLISKEFIKSKYIKNNVLSKYYSSSDILLNDHWEDMRENGFISNRIFDGLASGAFIITDNVRGIDELEQYVTPYKTKEQLKDLIEYYLSNPKERKNKAIYGKQFVLKSHTFEARAQQFSTTISNLFFSRA